MHDFREFDAGVTVRLPAWGTDSIVVSVPIAKVVHLHLDASGDVSIDGYPVYDGNFTIDHTLIGSLSSYAHEPQQVTVRLTCDRRAPYRSYLRSLDRVKEAFNSARDQAARRYYGFGYDELPTLKKQRIHELFRYRVAEDEPFAETADKSKTKDLTVFWAETGD
jgi:hypothetical protein